ncbi:MAG TPA: rod-binding protein [Candidatus Hydrogenedentes bacterium]|nr:rod-binding protein [Candidatus Hydrogenedentota bacterium]
MLYVNPIASNQFFREDSNARQEVRETQALKEFERLFLYQLLHEMRKTVPKDSLFGHSSQQDYFEEMFDDCLAGQLAESGQFGIAKQMQDQLKLSAARSAPINKADAPAAPAGRQI